MSRKAIQDLVTAAAFCFPVDTGQGRDGEASPSEPTERRSAEAGGTVLPYLEMTE